MRAIDISDRVRPLDIYPYDGYTISLKAFVHLHYSYEIVGDRIHIEMSDYLEKAPDTVIRDTCKAICAWSLGKRFKHPQLLKEYTLSEQFIIDNRPKYLERARGMRMTPQGMYKNLLDSIDRLMEQGFVQREDIENSFITWVEHMQKYHFAQCNQMFRVITVNPILDSPCVPDYVMDFVIYHEILHLRQDMTKIHRPHNAEFRGWEHQFPMYEEAESFLKRIYL